MLLTATTLKANNPPMSGPHAIIDRAAIAELSLSVPLFAGVAEQDLSLLLHGAWVERFGDGAILCAQGGSADRFFVVLDGHVELYLEDGGRRTVIEIAQRRAIVGEAALFEEGHYTHSARVVGYGKVLIMQSVPFLAALVSRNDLALGMLGVMSIRLRGLIQHISQLKLKTTAQRLGGFLLGLTFTAEGATTVRFPYDKRLAAENLGMSAESLSRALGRLAELGVESRADNVVAIPNVAALRDFCAEASD